MLKILFAILFIAINTIPANAWIHGSSGGSSFNGGKYQTNLNFPGLGGDFVTLDRFKYGNGGWVLRDNSGAPSPADMDKWGYPLPGSDAITNHLGVYQQVKVPAFADIGGNCIPARSAAWCLSARINGKGTFVNSGTIVTSVASSVSTGSTTTITFAADQDFRAGMEVPISGTTGVTATNGGGGSLTAGGTTGAWTVCAANLTPTTIQLCLNDQVTPLTTTGTAGGTTTVSYGRNAVGIATNARIVSYFTDGATAYTFGISAQDAVTPITTDANGVGGISLIDQGSEEVRWENCPYPDRECFSSIILSTFQAYHPGVQRALNTINTNNSQEVNWADRKPIGYYSYNASIYDRPSGVCTSACSYAGVATSVLTDFSVTLGSGAPVDGQQLIVSFDVMADVNVASGANALVTWPNHGLSNGQAIVFGTKFGGTAPGGITTVAVGVTQSTYEYFAITTCGSCNANTIQVARTLADAVAGTAITTSSTGTNVVAQASSARNQLTFTSGNATIGWPNNGLSVGDIVGLVGGNGSPLVYPLNQGRAYYVVIANTNDIQVSETPGGSAIAPLQSGTNFFGTKAPTLNLNGTGKIAINEFTSYMVGGSGGTQPVGRAGGQRIYASLTYDALLNVWIKRGGDAAIGNSFFVSGWPPELVLRFSILTGSHPWYTPPGYTVDRVAGPTDYNPSLYSYVRANAPSWMISRYETIPNEFWNGLFHSTSLMINHGVVYQRTAGWTPNGGLNQMAGKISSILGQAVYAAYGGVGVLDGTKCWAIAGVQVAPFINASTIASNAPRMTSPDYVGQSTPAPTGYTKTPAYKWTTHITASTYNTSTYDGTGTVETNLASAYSGGQFQGTFTAGTNNLSVSNLYLGATLDIGSVIWQGPGIKTPITIVSGSAPNWVTDTTMPYTTTGGTYSFYPSTADLTAVQTYVDGLFWGAEATATFSGNQMTLSGTNGWAFASHGNGGDIVTGPGVLAETQITAAPVGNQDGVYTLNKSQGISGPIQVLTFGVLSGGANNIANANVNTFAQTYCNGDGSCDGINSYHLRQTAYEGGYARDLTVVGRTQADQLFIRGRIVTSTSHMPTGQYGMVQKNCDNFKTNGGEFCSLFTLTGMTASNTGYSGLDDIYQPVPKPIIEGYRDLQ